MNLHTRAFDPEVLRLFGLEKLEGALPPLCSSLEVAGHVTEQAARACGLAPARR